MDKSTFLAALDTERARWNDTLVRIGETQKIQPGMVGEWSVKDLIAHVLWYEREMVGLLQRRSLAGGSPLWERPHTERNAAIYDDYRPWTLAKVQDEERAVYAQLRDLIGHLTDGDFTDPRRLDMPDDWQPWRILGENTYEHYQEHHPALAGIAKSQGLDLSQIFAAFPTLETERFTLRAIAPEDAADIFHIMSDPRVVRYLGRPAMASLDEAVQRVQAFATTFQEQARIPWAVTFREQRQLIGTCALFNFVAPHFRAEIGYSLASEWWGKGVMTEAASAVLTFGFTTIGLHSVAAQTDPANADSRRLLETLGFVQEGYFHEDFYNSVEGRFTDTTVFSLLKATWMSRMRA